MEPWIQFTRNGFAMAEEEMNRLEAQPVQGVQSCTVQSDMKKWAYNEGHWLEKPYAYIIAAHAKHCGWTQEGFTGMEIADETV